MDYTVDQHTINHKELCKLLAKRLNKSSKDAMTFVEALTKIFTEKIIADKYFRIRGLGSFKIITVMPRESVDISTGNKIVIESFNKIHFVPDKDLKNTSMTSVMPDDDEQEDMPLGIDEDSEDLSLEKFDDQAREIMEILEEIGENPIDSSSENSNESSPVGDMEDDSEEKDASSEIPSNGEQKTSERQLTTEPVSATTNEKAKPFEDEIVEPVSDAVTSEEIQHAESEENQENNNNQIHNVMEDNNSYNPNVPDIEIEEEEQEEEKKHHVVRDILIAVGVALLIVFGCFLFLRQQIVNFFKGYDAPAAQVPQVVVNPPVSTTPIQNAETQNEPVENKKVDYQAAEKKITYTKFITKVRVPAGVWLAKLSRTYYGETDLWVFIYDANKDHLSNPHFIPAGTVIKIPELSDDLKNLSNPNTKKIVDRFLKKYK